ncbi:MAG: pyridoxal phosphate-dependent aminotransferase [Chloroflexi bacterium]|nr:pyridoxal phosphate-dependent aminotransferase [Chloroflexota bacterium]
MRLAERMNFLGGEGMGDVLTQVQQRRARGERVIPMHAGEPDFDTPTDIVEAAVAALRGGQTHYTPAAGIPALRQAIAEEISKTRRITVSPDQVVVAPGVKPLIFFTMAALCQPGDDVICPDPAYPFYASLANFVGAKAVSLPLTMDTGFSIDFALLEDLVTPNTRLVVVNSPSNPTGAILTRGELEALGDIVLKHDLWILSDEIYSRLVYEDSFESIASVPGMSERTVLIDGFSKTYAMTGWRLGYSVTPRELTPHITKLVLNTLSCSVAFTQPAAVEALRGSQEPVHRMIETFRRRRDRLVSGINRIPGLACLKPRGAFYAFTKVSGVDKPSLELARYLLTEAGVAVYPGAAFGSQGEGFLRLSFACSEADIDEGLERIAGALARL